MKFKFFSLNAITVLFATLTLASAEAPQMEMTTPIPEGIVTPSTLETSIGTLNSFDGIVDAETSQLLYDNLDRQRAQAAFLSTIQISSMYAMEQGIRSFGPPNETVLIFEDLMDSTSLWLTGNTVSIYNFLWLELGDEPMVLETPPNTLGFVNDAWFLYVADFGNAGPDKGEGGKFLIVPHDYEADIPDGYFVARTNTKGNWVLWRGSLLDGSTAPAVADTKEHFRAYPLSQADNPPEMTFVNASGNAHNTIHRMDFGYWEEINQQIQDETLVGLSPEIRGLLASIGIIKGREFAPDDRMREILTDAAAIGSLTLRALAARPRADIHYVYPGESNWTFPFAGGTHDWAINGARLLDARTLFHFYATGVTPAMVAAPVGSGSQYVLTYLDKDGNALDGSKTYKVTLPADVPVNNFWSFTVYDTQTRSMLQTDERFPGLSGVDTPAPVANPDGSFDVYFGPTAPDGKEANWVQTIPGKSWSTMFRLYGPLEPWFNKTWRPGDVELVE